jgi:hypothetical protein
MLRGAKRGEKWSVDGGQCRVWVNRVILTMSRSVSVLHDKRTNPSRLACLKVSKAAVAASFRSIYQRASETRINPNSVGSFCQTTPAVTLPAFIRRHRAITFVLQ